MISEALFIAVISVILTAIGWIVIILFKQKDKIAEVVAKNDTLEKRHNDLVLEVTTMVREYSEKLREQEEDNLATRTILHELQITLAKLDVTFNHFNKAMDRLTSDFSTQKDILDELRFKIAK